MTRREKQREYERRYRSSPKGRAKKHEKERRWRQRHPERHNAKNRRWAKNNPERVAAMYRERDLLNPEKRYATTCVRNALRKGILVKQPCRDCSNPNVTAHHPDYSKPLEVVWLCRKCHWRADEQRRRSEG